MANIEIDRAIELLIESPENNNQVAKGTGIHPSTISNYRTKTTKPSVPNARLLIEYFTRKNTGATQNDNTITNPTKTQEMDPLAMDYINTLKEQLAKVTAVVEEQNAIIKRLTQKGDGEVLSRRVGAVKEKQDELTENL
jgi:hypothetical protein|nr:MAG TPA: helix-turn-helix domain protein [Caudoviricetes sp.]DAU90421.1 MAG TPA: helix-turn-helix domain protein [Caudoviricetes sp.]